MAVTDYSLSEIHWKASLLLDSGAQLATAPGLQSRGSMEELPNRQKIIREPPARDCLRAQGSVVLGVLWS